MNQPTTKKVLLCICTYNREELLVGSLEDALKQNYDNYKIVVVDQTTTHKNSTQLFLDNLPKNKVNYITSSTPSLTKARNVALKSEPADIYIFIDDDVSFDKNFIKNHVDAHKNAEVVQGRIIENNEPAKSHKPQWVNRCFRVSGSDNCDKYGKTNSVTGCNFSLSKKAVKKVGDFDENFYAMALLEDSDYGIRCYRAGLKMRFSPQAFLYHHRSNDGGVDTGVENHFFNESYYANQVYFAYKHLNWLVRCLFIWRLHRRGRKNIKKLINIAKSKGQKMANK